MAAAAQASRAVALRAGGPAAARGVGGCGGAMSSLGSLAVWLGMGLLCHAAFSAVHCESEVVQGAGARR